MIQAKLKVRLADGTTVSMTPEEHKVHIAERAALREQAEAARLEALTRSAGIYRLILVGPAGASQVFASNEEQAGEIIARRLPLWLEDNLPKMVLDAQDAPVGRVTNAKALRIVSVSGDCTVVRPGDVFPSAAELARLLQVKFMQQRIYQAKSNGGKTVTIKGVTFCLASDYDEVKGMAHGD